GEGAGAVGWYALEDRLEPAAEPYDDPSLLQQLARVLARERAAARGDDQPRARPELVGDRAFFRAKRVLAALGEQSGYCSSGSRFDRMVHVHEVPPEVAGHEGTDGRLAGTHEADQDDASGRLNHVPPRGRAARRTPGRRRTRTRRLQARSRRTRRARPRPGPSRSDGRRAPGPRPRPAAP